MTLDLSRLAALVADVERANGWHDGRSDLAKAVLGEAVYAEWPALLQELRASRAAVEAARRPTHAEVRDAVCNAMETWLRCIVREHGDEGAWRHRIECLQETFLMIRKSSLLDRLIFGREPLRIEKCPEHKGRWSGLEHPDRRCPHGCHLTGWLPAKPDEALRARAAEAKT